MWTCCLRIIPSGVIITCLHITKWPTMKPVPFYIVCIEFVLKSAACASTDVLFFQKREEVLTPIQAL